MLTAGVQKIVRIIRDDNVGKQRERAMVHQSFDSCQREEQEGNTAFLPRSYYHICACATYWRTNVTVVASSVAAVNVSSPEKRIRSRSVAASVLGVVILTVNVSPLNCHVPA